jgi:anti-sigma factor ChrR (cupin superfamily)
MRRQMTHPDSDVLAEYRAGLISGPRGARIAAHLSGCDHCAAVGSQLAEISVLLAAAPVPAMPDSVAQRLDTVLAAEAAKGNDAERAGARAPGERAAHPRRARRGGWRRVTVRVLAPAAAVFRCRHRCRPIR